MLQDEHSMHAQGRERDPGKLASLRATAAVLVSQVHLQRRCPARCPRSSHLVVPVELSRAVGALAPLVMVCASNELGSLRERPAELTRALTQSPDSVIGVAPTAHPGLPTLIHSERCEQEGLWTAVEIDRCLQTRPQAGVRPWRTAFTLPRAAAARYDLDRRRVGRVSNQE